MRGLGLRLRKWRSLASEEQDAETDREEAERQPLRQRKRTGQSLFVFPEKFNDEASR